MNTRDIAIKADQEESNISIVHKAKEIAPEGSARVYEALGASLKGNIAIKISTGEPGGRNFLQPRLIKDLVNRSSGTTIECNIAYPGRCNTTQAHWETIRDHEFLAIAFCDILDGDDDMAIPVESDSCLQENYVGTHLKNYNSMITLLYSKGYVMGGFGGALKSMSIGLASSRGKIWIHTSGTSNVFEDAFTADHDSFLESMADVDRSVIDSMGREKIVYISVANRLSVDCDCDAYPHDPEMVDIGIFVLADPVALDQVSVDAVYGSEDTGKRALIERMESRHGIHTVETAQTHGFGNHKYELVCIDQNCLANPNIQNRSESPDPAQKPTQKSVQIPA